VSNLEVIKLSDEEMAKIDQLQTDFKYKGSGIGRMLAKGFAVNGTKTILVDIDEKSLFGVQVRVRGGSEKHSENCRR
jgi:hypothetical protein